mmetsp:Transcript_62132/g.138412  ORF Transcript_62132/g.138412 Transcript_62132/m.138412 type:complete len:231 (-) Transcript_62132:74-766(-)
MLTFMLFPLVAFLRVSLAATCPFLSSALPPQSHEHTGHMIKRLPARMEDTYPLHTLRARGRNNPVRNRAFQPLPLGDMFNSSRGRPTICGDHWEASTRELGSVSFWGCFGSHCVNLGEDCVAANLEDISSSSSRRPTTDAGECIAGTIWSIWSRSMLKPLDLSGLSTTSRMAAETVSVESPSTSNWRRLTLARVCGEATPPQTEMQSEESALSCVQGAPSGAQSMSEPHG